jgi:hypothetical protein
MLALLLLGAAVASGACERECRPGSAPKTRQALLPPGSEVHCENGKTFQVDGHKVRLTHVEYGQLMDCPSGCFSSHVCAIEDGEQVFLLYAAWNTQQEKPAKVDQECPTLMRDSTWPDCKPSGVTHPLVSSAKFRAFAREEEGYGPFRYCVEPILY